MELLCVYLQQHNLCASSFMKKLLGMDIKGMYCELICVYYTYEPESQCVSCPVAVLCRRSRDRCSGRQSLLHWPGGWAARDTSSEPGSQGKRGGM